MVALRWRVESRKREFRDLGSARKHLREATEHVS